MLTDHLKDLSKTNLHNDIKSGDFDVGYIVETKVTSVWTENLKEMWGDIKNNQCKTV